MNKLNIIRLDLSLNKQSSFYTFRHLTSQD